LKNRTFIVSHAHARAPLTITGKTLTEAIENERLNPDIWKEVGGAPESENDGGTETAPASGDEDN